MPEFAEEVRVSRESILARGRTAAEAGMRDTCTIRRVTSETTDDHSGEIVKTYAVIYTGRCRVQQHQAAANQRDVGEDDVLMNAAELQLPMSVVGLEPRDEATIDTSADDQDLPGRVFLVRDLAHKTDATSRRVQCEERTG